MADTTIERKVQMPPPSDLYTIDIDHLLSEEERMHKLSLRASITSKLRFEECRVPAENMLPNMHGLRGPLSCLNEARYGIAWRAMGAARACYKVAVDYARTRIQFNRPMRKRTR